MNLSDGPDTERDEEPLRAHRYPEPGEIVANRYRVDRLLGIGGFARVYAATQLEIERRVALKVMSTWTKSSGLTTVEKRFYREARLLSCLRGPNTIQMFDYGRTDNLLFLVFEYVDGRDLGQVLETSGPLAEERAVRIMVQVLRSLREAHANDILHRDVKPANVMVFDHLGETDCVKVLDFGIAKAVAAEAAGQSNLTVEGGVIGTPRYMSPEQSRGLPLAEPSDLFSAGLVFYEMLVGEPAIESGELSNVQRFLSNRRLRLPEQVDVSRRTRGVVDRLLAASVEARFRSADEVLAALGHPSESHVTVAGDPVESSTGFPVEIAEEALRDEADTAALTQPWPRRERPVDEDATTAQHHRATPPDEEPSGGGRFEGVGLVVALVAAVTIGGLVWTAWPDGREPAAQPRAEQPERPRAALALPRVTTPAEGSGGFEAAGRRVLRASIAARAAADASAETLAARERPAEPTSNGSSGTARPEPARDRRPKRRPPVESENRPEPVEFEPIDDL